MTARRRYISLCGELAPGNCFGNSGLNDGDHAQECCHAPSDISGPSRSRHFDLIGGSGHPWSNDLVTVSASSILVMGFAGAFAALLIR